MTPLAKKVAELFGRPDLAAEKSENQMKEQPSAPSWPCPHCGQEAEIEDVCPSRSGEQLLTLWNCQRCQVWAVTPSGINEPAKGWVSKAKQRGSMNTRESVTTDHICYWIDPKEQRRCRDCFTPVVGVAPSNVPLTFDDEQYEREERLGVQEG